jgi:hypothetical protein
MRVIRGSVSVLLLSTLMAAPVLAQDERPRTGRRGAVLGTLIGIAGGAAVSALFLASQDCNEGMYETHKEEVLRCYAVPASIIGGAGIAGYFIGRSADKRHSSTAAARPSRGSSADGARLPPPITLRAPKALEAPHPAFRSLFVTPQAARRAPLFAGAAPALAPPGVDTAAGPGEASRQ